jgi:hypothetical protein
MTDSKKTFDEIKSFSKDQIAVLIAQVLTHAEKLCIASGNNSELSVDDRALADTTRDYLRQNSKQILDLFTEQSIELLAGEKIVKESGAESLTLSLVDDDTLEEMITIGELTGKVQDHYDLRLKAIKRGLVRLGKNLDFEPEPEAFTPKKLALILHEYLGDSELPLTGKKYLYDAFAEIAGLELGTLYDGVLALLQDHGVITESENPASANFKVIYQYRQSQGNAGVAPAGAPPSTPGGAQSGPAYAPGYSQDAGLHAGPTAGGLQPVFTPPGGAAGYPPPMMPARLAPVAASAINPALFADSETSRALYSFLSNPGQSVTTSAGVPLPSVDSRELLKLLSNLQNLNNQDLAESALENPSAISQQINQTITDKTREWAKQVSGPERNVIELVNNLFVAILEDPNMVDPVKVQIGRLQIPYIKAALLDITLLKETAHPARLLLNELSLHGATINDREDPLYVLIREIVQNVLENFETNLNIFSENLLKLRKAVQTEQKQLETVEKTTRGKAESQAKLLHAKKQIVSRLRRYLKGKSLPKELHGLVLKGFAPLFLAIYRRDGETSPHWEETTNLFRQIIESVQPRESLYQLSVIVKRSGELIKKTQQNLQQANLRLDSIDLIKGLKKLYQERADEFDLLKPDDPDAIEPDAPDPLELEDQNELAIDTIQINQPSPEELLARLPGQLQTGTWCEVYLGRDKPPRRLKVSSILPDTSQLVFVDGTGQQAEIKDIVEFLDELDCEQSRILMEENLFDKALSAVISNMNLMRATA